MFRPTWSTSGNTTVQNCVQNMWEENIDIKYYKNK